MPLGVRQSPHPKACGIIEYLIKTYTNEGDLGSDNVAGSGSNWRGVQNLNRNFMQALKLDVIF